MAQLYTVPEVAARLRISVRKTWQLVADGRLPHKRIDRCVRVSESDIDRFLEDAA